MPKAQPSHVAKPGVFVALVYDALKAGPFASIADLAEAVKCGAARLHVRYDARQITDAIAHVARVSPSPIVGPFPLVPPPDRLISEPPVIGRDDARRILSHLTAAPDRAACGPRQMPDPPLARRRVDTHALKVVAQAIAMTAAHVDELENTIPPPVEDPHD